MESVHKAFFTASIVFVISAFANLSLACADTGVTINNKFSPSWESLSKTDRQPEWFQDAKLGIYFHWGVYSVPAFDNEWYPRWMYFNDLSEGWGAAVHPYHVKNFGSLNTFNYHDFIPMFKAQHFDAEDWVNLFENAGAKFAGPVAIHHDGFAMWGSEINPWNVRDMGPKRDITEELLRELKSRDLKTITTFHHARLLQRYANTSSEWGGQGKANSGWDSHYPYHPNLITSTTDPKLRLLYGNITEEEFLHYWSAQVNEVVEKYAPDIIWFDSWLDKIPDHYRREVVANHFNRAARNNQQALVAYKQNDLPADVGILDIEQGGKTDISDDYWLTDITISQGSWSFTRNLQYKDPALLIRNMIDVWSKKGTVLLNVSPRADGVIPPEQRAILLTIGDWIKKHKQAVYKTRAFDIYGYGDAEFEAGHFGGQSATMSYTNKDIRFSRSKDGNAIFIYVLGLPEENSTLHIKHLAQKEEGINIQSITIIGSNTPLKWTSKPGNEIEIHTPAKENMDEIATVFKVTLK